MDRNYINVLYLSLLTPYASVDFSSVKMRGNQLQNIKFLSEENDLNNVMEMLLNAMIYRINCKKRFNWITKSAGRILKIRGDFPSEESVLALITSIAIDKGGKAYILLTNRNPKSLV